MKKITAAFLAASVLMGTLTVLAAPTPAPTASPAPSAIPTDTPAETAAPLPSPIASPVPTASPAPTASPVTTFSPAQLTSKEFILDIEVTPHRFTISDNAVVELYDEDGKLLDTRLRYVGWDTPSVQMVFEVPEYPIGKIFYVKLVSGLRSLKYYDDFVQPGGSLKVQTYTYIDENGEKAMSNGAAMRGNPRYDKEIFIYWQGNLIENPSPSPRMVDGNAMMPVRAVAEAMGLNVKYDAAYDSVVCSFGDNEIIFNAGSKYMTVFGEDVNAPCAAKYIDGSLFVSVRAFADALGAELQSLDFGEHIDLVIGDSPALTEYRSSTPVNKYGITSRTNYLVWVSKHEYKVRVYKGKQYCWELQKEFPCALGAWNTPTITGQFEYIERTQWNYNGYYVGPVLRFHNGYALHSTLLYYGGGEYDGRVGVNISHGCVRLHPQDINWIADTIPFRTRIYITE